MVADGGDLFVEWDFWVCFWWDFCRAENAYPLTLLIMIIPVLMNDMD